MFLQAWAARLGDVFPDHTVRLFGVVPSQKSECPRINIDFVGNAVRTSTASRSRRETSLMRIQVSFHKWVAEIDSDDDRQELAFALLDENDLNTELLIDSLRRLRLEGLPDGLMLTGSGDFSGITVEIPANCRDTVATSIFVIQNLPLEYTSKED